MRATSCSGHRTVGGTDRGLHPAVDGQMDGQTTVEGMMRATSCSGQTTVEGMMRATSCSGQTTVEGMMRATSCSGQMALMEGYILQWTDDIDEGLHPAVDRQWRALMEGYILQWTDSGGH